MNYLFIINDGPYGNERPYNALHLALNLVKREGVNVQVFLMGDGVQWTVARQNTPEGYYNIERMLKSIARRGEVARKPISALSSHFPRPLRLDIGAVHDCSLPLGLGSSVVLL